MAIFKCKFEFFHDPVLKVSRPKFGLRPTICGTLHWTTDNMVFSYCLADVVGLLSRYNWIVTL